MSPLVSIITPCFNSEKFIEKTILSVLCQTYKNIEYIIVDGNSTDRTHQIIQNYKNKLSHVIIEEDEGMYSALNKGIKIASGEIIAYINSDDLYFHNTVERIVNFFNLEPNISMVYGDLKVIDENDKILYNWFYPKFRFNLFVSNNHCTIGQVTSFWRSNVHEEVGFFDSSYKLAGDFEFYARVGEKLKINKINHFLGYYRIHQDSLTNNWEEINLQEIQNIHERYLKTRMQKIFRKLLGIIQKTIFRLLNYRYIFLKLIKSIKALLYLK